MDVEREKGPAITRDAPSAEGSAFRLLHDVTKNLHASLDLTETLDRVVRGVVGATGFGVAALSLWRPGGFFEVVSVEGDADCRAALLGAYVPLADWARIQACAELRGDSVFFVDSRRSPDWAAGIATHRLDFEPHDHVDAWLPEDGLIVDLKAPTGECVGLLSVDRPNDGRRPSVQQIDILELFADHAGIAIQHAHLHSTLRHQQEALRHAALHDALTGIANRAQLNVEGPRMAAIPNSHLAVVAIDLDDFKAVNDTGGHQAGDEVLAALVERMAHAIRPGDLLARAGGDEFIILINGGDDLHDVVDSLIPRLETIASEPVSSSRGLYYIGASVGAEISSTPCDFAALLCKADTKMYERKRTREAKKRYMRSAG
ncbi:MAG: sensor domain-containing diguanylate cyclase [Candidatus Eremiobacteraeota bacterium]|nr:sensor domain-containing diguanylate cyclase [Candidatus Eremiobacteraeota bacterium]